jgi:hypothetical protein
VPNKLENLYEDFMVDRKKKKKKKKKYKNKKSCFTAKKKKGATGIFFSFI